MTSPVFMETTACYDLALGDPSVRRRIENLLRDRPLHVSTYAQMEFHRTALQAIRVLLEIMYRRPADDHSETFAYLLRGANRSWDATGRPVSERGRVRATGIVAALIDHYKGMAVTAEVVRGTLEDWLALLEDLSWLGVTVVRNDTDCDLVRPDRNQGRRWPMRCNARHAQCQQTIWLRTRRAELESVLKALRQLQPPPDGRLVATLERVLGDGVMALGERRCWPIGDLILALEATETGTMITSNRVHFEPIALVLGLRLITYSAT